MSTAMIITAIMLFALLGWFVGRARAMSIAGGNAAKLHSRPPYYGSYVFIWTALPATFLLGAWLAFSPSIVDQNIRGTLPDNIQTLDAAEQSLAMGMVRAIGGGLRLLDEVERTQLMPNFVDTRALLASKGVALASNGEDYMIPAASRLVDAENTSRFWMALVTFALAIAGFAYAMSQIKIETRARNRVERVVLGSLIVAASIAILTTIGIVFSMISETGRFFTSVPPLEFFFGSVWDPRFAAADNPNAVGQFGLIPLLAGTLYIAFVAMLVAVPIGLFAAIYMSEYASGRMRSVVKPLLEVLAGIPTIVYGFFALVTIGPFFRDLSASVNGLLGGDYSSFIQAQSVLTAGVVMGIMLIPFVSSLSDDIITAVPRSLREGSLGLGATSSETIRNVVLPAALPGVVGALLLTASRAIGETMIVVLAAGVAARLSINPFEPMTTITVKIVSQLTGDLEFTSPQTLVAFALGITLFFITLVLNVYALYIVRKYREQYE